MSNYWNGTISPKEDMRDLGLNAGVEYDFRYSPDPPGFEIGWDDPDLTRVVFFSAKMFDPIDLTVWECCKCESRCFHHEKYRVPDGDGAYDHACPECLKSNEFYRHSKIHGHAEGKKQ